MRIAAVIAVAVAIAPPAFADDAAPPPAKQARKRLPPYVPGPPDPAAIEAAQDANVSPASGQRTGMTFTAAIGTAYQVGGGLDGDPETTGGSGAFSFRLGRVASRDAILVLELSGTVFPYRSSTDTILLNQSTVLALGGQNYVAPAVWVRAGVGLANFTTREQGAGGRNTTNDFGVGATTGGGVDIVRRGSVRLALEVLANAAYYFDGLVVGGGFALSLGTY